MYFLSYSINLYILFFRYKLEIVGGMGPTVGLVSCRVDQFYVAAANEKLHCVSIPVRSRGHTTVNLNRELTTTPDNNDYILNSSRIENENRLPKNLTGKNGLEIKRET